MSNYALLFVYGHFHFYLFIELNLRERENLVSAHLEWRLFKYLRTSREIREIPEFRRQVCHYMTYVYGIYLYDFTKLVT